MTVHHMFTGSTNSKQQLHIYTSTILLDSMFMFIHITELI